MKNAKPSTDKELRRKLKQRTGNYSQPKERYDPRKKGGRGLKQIEIAWEIETYRLAFSERRKKQHVIPDMSSI